MGAIIALLVVCAGAITGVVILTRSADKPSASPAATVTVTSTPMAKPTPKQRPVGCVNGDTNGPCPGKEFEKGPALPASLRGQPYTCYIMADTSECVTIFANDPSTGQCTEFFYVAPRAPGTEDGWRVRDYAAPEYECP
jgi:hypothetical protein